MSWNVRGLNSPARRATVCEVADSHRLVVLCLQETKIETWSPTLVKEVGGSRLDACAVLPADGTRGGAAILWDSSKITITTNAIGQFSITARATLLQSNNTFWITTVYGPTNDNRKEEFLAELIRAMPPTGEPWLINGDFNVIYEARDKSNLNLNRRIMGRFRAAIDRAGLREIKCKNMRFTWSNERENPTFVAIDKMFCNLEWETLFPSYILMAASTTCSDHCPLMLSNAAAPHRKAIFRFETFWTRFPHFHETKLQFHLASEVVLRLDVAEEKRQLTRSEFWLWKILKLKIVGLAVLERIRRRQASCITWPRAGDASTAFFQTKQTSMRRRNFIQCIQSAGALKTSHADKAAVVHEHFSLLGQKRNRSRTINWEALELPRLQAGADSTTPSLR
ncbi:uncharacterized protein [Aegilops tauschii subsp. strangulata]|uniref:uncharacterized protein n=1 Tax=Aegilops tauschii subsp. strangulata TaxID=200361 RepID=UPI003CC84433